ncbi:MAG: response regulator [Pseudomonadota bacterium]
MNPPNPVVALVENDLPTNRAFARLLRAHGFTVEAYVSAELLLGRAGPASLDCLLLDIDLDGMSGLELQQLLRRQGVGVPVIFVTGRDDQAARVRAHEIGCSAFLNKPVKGEVLVEAIRAAIAGSRGPPAFTEPS